MPSLVRMFPTLGLLVSGARQLFSKAGKDDGGVDPGTIPDLSQVTDDGLAGVVPPDASGYAVFPDQAGEPQTGGAPADLTTRADGRPSSTLAVGQKDGHPLSSRNAEGMSIPGLYETWVELDERVKQAHNDLQGIMTTREEAAILRRQAQKALDEGEAIRAEARSLSEAAWKAFERGFAVNAKGLPNRWTTVREIDEAMKTFTALQRATHAESWQEADRTRQRATTELLKVLTALGTAMAHADRELKEATNLPSVAEALKQSAQDELRCAQAIRNELLLLGQEALDELDVPALSRIIGPQPATISETSKESSGETPVPRREPGLLGTAFSGDIRTGAVSRAGSAARTAAPSRRPPDAHIGPAAAAWESSQPLPGPARGAEAASPAFEEYPRRTIEDIAPRPVERIPVEPPFVPADEVYQVDEFLEELEAPQLEEELLEPVSATVADESEADLELPSPPIPTPQIEPLPVGPTLEEEIAAARPANESPGSAASAIAQELEREIASLRPSHEASDALLPEQPFEATPVSSEPAEPIPASEPAIEPAIEPIEAIRPVAPETVVEAPPAPRLSEAELLRREMEAGAPTSIVPKTETPIAPQELEHELEAMRPLLAHTGQTETIAPPGPASQPPGQSEPAAAYSGRIYLMFPSSLSQSRLESVWDVLDHVGSIADTRLISRDAGIQFTLDLGNKSMDIDELRRLIPNCQLSALEKDRLQVDWPG